VLEISRGINSDYLHGDLVFREAGHNLRKILFWDRGGLVLYCKRLARGQFRMPRVTRWLFREPKPSATSGRKYWYALSLQRLRSGRETVVFELGGCSGLRIHGNRPHCG